MTNCLTAMIRPIKSPYGIRLSRTTDTTDVVDSSTQASPGLRNDRVIADASAASTDFSSARRQNGAVLWRRWTSADLRREAVVRER